MGSGAVAALVGSAAAHAAGVAVNSSNPLKLLKDLKVTLKEAQTTYEKASAAYVKSMSVKWGAGHDFKDEDRLGHDHAPPTCDEDAWLDKNKDWSKENRRLKQYYTRKFATASRKTP
jgi:hypothetical protein